MSLDAIGIVSENLELSVKFYGMFGLSFKSYGNADHLEGVSPSGVRIMLDSVALMKSLHSNWIKGTGSGIILAFKQDSADQVDELYSKIVANEFKSLKAPWDAFWDQRYASVFDPDGYQIDIFADLR